MNESSKKILAWHRCTIWRGWFFYCNDFMIWTLIFPILKMQALQLRNGIRHGQDCEQSVRLPQLWSQILPELPRGLGRRSFWEELRWSGRQAEEEQKVPGPVSFISLIFFVLFNPTTPNHLNREKQLNEAVMRKCPRCGIVFMKSEGKRIKSTNKCNYTENNSSHLFQVATKWLAVAEWHNATYAERAKLTTPTSASKFTFFPKNNGFD